IPYRQALAQLADQSSNPIAFAYAYAGCQSEAGKRIPACSRITARRWAELEPDNAAAWLSLVDEAIEREDEAARAEGLARAGGASPMDLPYAAMLRPIDSAWVASAAPLDRIATQVAVATAALDLRLAPYTAAGKSCEGGVQLADSARLVQCSRIANLM